MGGGGLVSARGIFDLRCWIEGEDEAQVYAQINELVRTARLLAPAGVSVRYSTLRNPDRTTAFEGTMRPSWMRKRPS